MNHQNLEETIKEFLKDTSDKFNILPSKIDIRIQKEYIKLSEKITEENSSTEQIVEKSKKLFDNKTPITEKKILLIELANTGSVEAYRIIEKFIGHDKEMKAWKTLSLQECRILLENGLTDKNTGLISTGLGGKDDKLRYFILLVSSKNNPFSKTQKEVIKREYELICEKFNSKIDKLDFGKGYSSLTLLIPISIAVDKVVMKGIKQCNKLGNFLIEYYFVTNTHIPNKSETISLAKEIREENLNLKTQHHRPHPNQEHLSQEL